MLSLIDLLDAGSLDLSLAGYLAAAMRGGASLLVGARPGGAGKTTVMAALLNLLPDGTAIRTVANAEVLREAVRDEAFGATCYLAHEISPGFYHAYIWGQQAREFFRLAGRGHIVSSNLHADTLDELQHQLCSENGVAPEDLAAVELKLFLRVASAGGGRRRGRVRRWVSHVYESDGRDDRLVWRGGPDAFQRQDTSRFVSEQDQEAWIGRLAALRTRGVRRIEDVRRAVLGAARSSLDLDIAQ
jgi:hypothetical protein